MSLDQETLDQHDQSITLSENVGDEHFLDPSLNPLSEQIQPPLEEGTGELKRGESHLEAFLFQFEQETHSEQKIRLSLDFMRVALLGGSAPRFREFWEGRQLCLPLFKESLSVKSRSVLWAEYVALSAEARRVKEVLDEHSAFAVEQIELAIQALERELEHYDVTLSHCALPVFPQYPVLLKQKRQDYEARQKELHLLNTMAARVNGLRKELIKTDMRIRIKNQLFARLSLCGDRIFPLRKELIQSISQAFIQDVSQFVEIHFADANAQKVPLYVLREEIKAFQLLAKCFTLNTQSFTEVRHKLSECWDQVKQQDKERKKEVAQKRQEVKENYDAMFLKIQAFAAICETDVSLEQVNAQAQELTAMMNGLALGREELKELSDLIYRSKRPVLERARSLQDARRQKELEVEREKQQQIEGFKQRLQALLADASECNYEQLALAREELIKEANNFLLSKAEKLLVDRALKQLKDLINEKKERALMDLSEDDLKSLEQLKGLLEERLSRRHEIKVQLEIYRKALGGSGFDFEKAMMYREMLEAERATLDRINGSIDEIEEKIDQIEGSI